MSLPNSSTPKRKNFGRNKLSTSELSVRLVVALKVLNDWMKFVLGTVLNVEDLHLMGIRIVGTRIMIKAVDLVLAVDEVEVEDAVVHPTATVILVGVIEVEEGDLEVVAAETMVVEDHLLHGDLVLPLDEVVEGIVVDPLLELHHGPGLALARGLHLVADVRVLLPHHSLHLVLDHLQ